MSETYKTQIGNSTYSVDIPSDGFIISDEHGVCFKGDYLEEAQLRIALTVLRHNVPNVAELKFARKACGLNYEDIASEISDVEIRLFETPQLQQENSYTKTQLRKYTNLLIDECFRRLKIIQVSRQVSVDLVE